MQIHWNWPSVVWHWLALHYGVVIGSVAAAIGTAVTTLRWWYEFSDRRLKQDKERVLTILRSEMAFAGLGGKTMEQIIAASNPKFRKSRLEVVLRNLANENPPRVHCFGGRWYLGPLPPEVSEMLLRRPRND